MNKILTNCRNKILRSAIFMLVVFFITSTFAFSYIPSMEATSEIRPIFKAKFGVYTIDAETAKRITNKSYKPNKNIKISDLRLVKVAYQGFDNLPHNGELIVNRKVAYDVLQIFSELYKAKFKIERISLVDNYGANDIKSMNANNTSSFNYRPIMGGKTLSKHALGLAIDINPVQNPYISGKLVLPAKAKNFLNRKNVRPGMIIKYGKCYQIFIKHGWTWGGNWKSPKDYQHFEKKI